LFFPCFCFAKINIDTFVFFIQASLIICLCFALTFLYLFCLKAKAKVEGDKAIFKDLPSLLFIIIGIKIRNREFPTCEAREGGGKSKGE